MEKTVYIEFGGPYLFCIVSFINPNRNWALKFFFFWLNGEGRLWNLSSSSSLSTIIDSRHCPFSMSRWWWWWSKQTISQSSSKQASKANNVGVIQCFVSLLQLLLLMVGWLVGCRVKAVYSLRNFFFWLAIIINTHAHVIFRFFFFWFNKNNSNIF